MSQILFIVSERQVSYVWVSFGFVKCFWLCQLLSCIRFALAVLNMLGSRLFWLLICCSFLECMCHYIVFFVFFLSMSGVICLCQCFSVVRYGFLVSATCIILGCVNCIWRVRYEGKDIHIDRSIVF